MAYGFARLSELQYAKFLDSDMHTPGDVEQALRELGRAVPGDYADFLRQHPDAGIFEQQVACIGSTPAPCAPERVYPITLLYGLCSNALYDLLQVRANQYEIPLDYLLIGEDVGGNQFALSLGEATFGKVYFLYAEEPIEQGQGMYLLADDFLSFVASLVVTAT